MNVYALLTVIFSIAFVAPCARWEQTGRELCFLLAKLNFFLHTRWIYVQYSSTLFHCVQKAKHKIASRKTYLQRELDKISQQYGVTQSDLEVWGGNTKLGRTRCWASKESRIPADLYTLDTVYLQTSISRLIRFYTRTVSIAYRCSRIAFNSRLINLFNSETRSRIVISHIRHTSTAHGRHATDLPAVDWRIGVSLQTPPSRQSGWNPTKLYSRRWQPKAWPYKSEVSQVRQMWILSIQQ